MTETHIHLDRLKRIASTPAGEPDGEDEYAAFASGRLGLRPQLTVIFRTAAGRSHGFAYAHLYAVDYDPSVGIVLTFTRHRVTLAGRHLDELFRYLTLHRVQTVQEIDPLHADTLPAGTPVVTGLGVQPVRDGEG